MSSKFFHHLANDNRICSWVPAVFMSKNIGQSRIYGGVCLFPTVDFGYVRANPQAYSLSAYTELKESTKAEPSNDSDAPSDDHSSYAYQYENGRKEEKERMKHSQQRWITVYLQSSCDTSNPFAFSVQFSEDENETQTFDNVDNCLDYLSTVNNDYVLVVVSDKYANDKQILIKLQESLPVSVIYRKLDGQSLYTEQDLKDICPKLQGSFTIINSLSLPIKHSMPLVQMILKVSRAI